MLPDDKISWPSYATKNIAKQERKPGDCRKLGERVEESRCSEKRFGQKGVCLNTSIVARVPVNARQVSEKKRTSNHSPCLPNPRREERDRCISFHAIPYGGEK